MLKAEKNLALKKVFYDTQGEFTSRSLAEYRISPGTRAKFNLIKKHLGKRKFTKAIDAGCSGNSFLHVLTTVSQKFFLDLAQKPLQHYVQHPNYFPIMGSITQIPIPDESFDLVCALDVIEHIKHDVNAAEELVRILKSDGILVITVPHRQKFYTYQDQLIGHYRRYELDQLNNLFVGLGMKTKVNFGVYGQLMRVQMIQASNPQETEDSINNLRDLYFKNVIFRKIWDKIVKIGAFIMELDARFQKYRNLMNICVIYQKI